MQKAHLYEAILLVNRGVDEAVCGLKRLKRAKDSQLDSACFDEELVLFEDHRARLNSYFCTALQRSEQQDSVRFETHYREYEKRTLDEVQVYRETFSDAAQRSQWLPTAARPNLVILHKPGVGIPPVTSKDLKAVQDAGRRWKHLEVLCGQFAGAWFSWLERLPVMQEVAGLSHVAPAISSDCLSRMGDEHFLRMCWQTWD